MNRILLFASLCALTAGCGGEVIDASQSGESIDDLHAVSCNPRDGAGCDRAESCLTVLGGTRGEQSVCSASRCTGPRDCRAGYACRLQHCIALERSRPEPEVREPARDLVRNVRDPREELTRGELETVRQRPEATRPPVR